MPFWGRDVVPLAFWVLGHSLVLCLCSTRLLDGLQVHLLMLSESTFSHICLKSRAAASQLQVRPPCRRSLDVAYTQPCVTSNATFTEEREQALAHRFLCGNRTMQS